MSSPAAPSPAPTPPPPATFAEALRRGVRTGLSTVWELAVVMVPVYFVVTAMSATPLMGWISRALAPAMGLFGLPGSAAVPLVSGLLINFYASLGAMVSLHYTPQQVTVLGVMMAVAHSLPMEAVVLSKMGARGGRITLIRLGAAALVGVLARFIPLGGS